MIRNFIRQSRPWTQNLDNSHYVYSNYIIDNTKKIRVDGKNKVINKDKNIKNSKKQSN